MNQFQKQDQKLTVPPSPKPHLLLGPSKSYTFRPSRSVAFATVKSLQNFPDLPNGLWGNVTLYFPLR